MLFHLLVWGEASGSAFPGELPGAASCRLCVPGGKVVKHLEQVMIINNQVLAVTITILASPGHIPVPGHVPCPEGSILAAPWALGNRQQTYKQKSHTFGVSQQPSSSVACMD